MWFADQPIYTIWHRNRSKLDDNGEIDWAGEGALIVRPQAAVAWVALDAAGCAFLDVCMAGGTLADAANAALAARQDADLARLIATLLDVGAFGRVDRINEQP